MIRLIAICLSLAAMAWAQNSSSVTGTITDKSSAAVGGAKVLALNQDTQVSREAETDANGLRRSPRTAARAEPTVAAASIDVNSRVICLGFI